jgi:hypothetical protein
VARAKENSRPWGFDIIAQFETSSYAGEPLSQSGYRFLYQYILQTDDASTMVNEGRERITHRPFRIGGGRPDTFMREMWR